MKKNGVKGGLCLIFGILACFLLVGCSGGSNKNELVLNIGSFQLKYVGDVKLSKVALKTDDLSDVVDLYQEEGDDIGYRDSLLIARSYSQRLGINAFAQQNLDVLEDQGLVLSNVSKDQISIECEGDKINAVLVEYEIIEGLVPEIPKLYLSQFFIPEGNNVLLISFITENFASRNNMSKAFKQIK